MIFPVAVNDVTVETPDVNVAPAISPVVTFPRTLFSFPFLSLTPFMILVAVAPPAARVPTPLETIVPVIKPFTVSQAMRISGVNPSDITILSLNLKKID